MSDTTVAIVILPFLIGLTIVLESARVGCTRLSRRLREGRLAQAKQQEGECASPAHT